MRVPYWLDPQPTPLPQLQGKHSADVVVIGAGICGSSAALHLAEQGLDVVQLEARQIATSATGRNAGFILQGTAERYDRAVALMGRERARRIHAWSLENHKQMAETITRLGLDCEYQARGSLQLASSAQEEAELRASTALLNEDGFDARLLSGDQLPQVFRSTGHQVAVHMADDGEVHPARFVQGVCGAASKAGVRLFEQSRVTSLDASTPGDVRVRTEQGSVQASLVVIATNARAGELIPWAADKVDPVRGQMLATAPMPRLFDLPIYANHGYDYWRQDSHGRVVLGGWRNLDPDAEVGHAEILNDEIQANMTAFLQRFPWGRPLEITHRWSGIMGFSRDGLPLVGPAPGLSGAVMGAGFTGHGFGFAWLAGQALAALVTDGSHPLCEDLDPRRMG